MQAFAQRPTTTRQTVPAKPATSSRAHFGQSRDFSPIPPPSKLPVNVQAKLRVNTPGDIYELEADRVAEQVMLMPEPQPRHPCPCGGGCPKCKNGQGAHEHQRLQTKAIQASDMGQIAAPLDVHEVVRSSGSLFDPQTREFMERRFGHDFNEVRVHTDARAAEAASSIDARAFTADGTVVFGARKYAPQTQSGRKLLAHELAHVVQQQHSTERKIQRQASAKASPMASKPKLSELWKAVASTSVGKRYLDELTAAKKKQPTLSWGETPTRAEFDDQFNVIVLNNVDYTLTDNEWKQVIALELGNAANRAKISEIRGNAKKDPPSREAFIESLESIEFDTRVAVIKAYEAGEFCSPINTPECPSIFDTSVKDFAKYIADPRGEAHRELFGAEWDQEYRKKYSKMHSTK